MSILLTTKLRNKVLTYAFTHPDETYYVRQLAGIIGADAGNLSRELRLLEAEGVYLSLERGKEKYYSLNKRYPLFAELKEFVFKTTGVSGSLKELVSRYKGISRAFIYGSFATDKQRNSSDVDLVLVGQFPQDKFTRDLRGLESRLNREINFTSFTEEEFQKEKQKQGSFLNIVLRDGTVLLKGSLHDC